MFSNGECQEIYPHNEISIYNDESLDVGSIWDDHDLILCYRKGRKGFWARYNFDGSYCLCSITIMEFTEGWYSGSRRDWMSMNQETIWSNIEKYYQRNINMYKWKSENLLSLVKKGIDNQISNKLFVRGYRNCVDITLNNPIAKRSFENMVQIYLNDNNNEYTVCFLLNYKDMHSSKKYKTNMEVEILNECEKWIISSI